MSSIKNAETLASLGARALAALDSVMLRVGKRLVDDTPNVFDVAENDVLLVIDPTDDVGAQILVLHLRANGRGATEAAAIVDRLAHGNATAAHGRRRFVALWLPTDVLVHALREYGANVPAEWPSMLERDDLPHGLILTLLFRGQGRLLCAIDFARIDAAAGPAENLGRRPVRNVQ